VCGVAGRDEVAVLTPKDDAAVPFAVLSQFIDAAYANAILGSGNPRRAYLFKDNVVDPEKLVEACRAAAAGVPMLDTAIVGAILDIDSPNDPGLDRLTAREGIVLALLGDGASNAAIAERLGIPARAVERHINAIFNKLEIDDDPARNRRVLAALRYARAR
jgi:DNA-binding NarL/FixJ family response regulator